MYIFPGLIPPYPASKSTSETTGKIKQQRGLSPPISASKSTSVSTDKTKQQRGLSPPIPAFELTSVTPDLTTARLEQQPDLLLHKKEGYIEDMTVVSPGTLLVSNSTKKCVQLVDSKNGEVLTEVQVHDIPHKICLTDRHTAAVSIMDKKTIQLIQVRRIMTRDRVLTTSEDILGISSTYNSLVVSYSKPPWLEVISTKGKILHQFQKTGETKHFQYPAHLCVLPGETILISDSGTNTITKVDESLNILQTFTSPLLHGPWGITAVTEDKILVCCYRNDSILLLQPSTNTMTTLLGKDDVIKYPDSLAYCPDQKKLYFATRFYATIKVYQIT